ncbi:MAG: PEP-CTERM sorting domain-containing protein [Planctomycetia bacterium]|nr:PEP-CTERM sorting domain-containing protein [Planctomycetia bacterium]
MGSDTFTVPNGYSTRSSEAGIVNNRIPEPSTLILGAFGVAGLIAWGWRRQPKRAS